MFRIILMSSLVVLPLFTLAISPEETPVQITVVVSGATPNTGQIIGQLYISKDQYLKNPLQEETVEVDSSGAGVLQFTGQTKGVVGVMVFHDKNLNGRLDRNFIGIPKEPTATSNNARGRFGPPKWKDIRFDVGETAQKVEIRLSNVQDDE